MRALFAAGEGPRPARIGDQPEGGDIEHAGLVGFTLRAIDEKRAQALNKQQGHGHGQKHLAHQAAGLGNPHSESIGMRLTSVASM